MKKLLLMTLSLMLLLIVSACQPSADTILVHNPYDNVDWDEHALLRAALHNHTTHSDGSMMPHEVVDLYHGKHFDVLAITDHDYQKAYHTVTYPWTFSDLNPHWADRDPETLGMLAIPGSEFSRYHHMAALYTDHLPGADDDIEAQISHIHNEADSLIFFAHPGRYWSWIEDYEEGDLYSPSWYMDFFNAYPVSTLPGFEVFSQRDRYEFDRVLWDTILSELMPDRPVHGFSVDDFHGAYAGYSFTEHLVMGEVNHENFRQSIIDGAFFAVNRRRNDDTYPQVSRITVDEDKRTIHIEASDYDLIQWVSGIDPETGVSRIVGEGDTFDYGNFEGNYVRAQLILGEGSHFRRKTALQPFGFAPAPSDD